jgi:hypothetical protein
LRPTLTSGLPIFAAVPRGIGRRAGKLRAGNRELDECLGRGARKIPVRRSFAAGMTRRLSVLAGVALASAALVACAAAPPLAAAAQSDNVTEVAQISNLAAAISINFIGETMFVSTVHGVYSYDVSNPASPRLLGVLPMYIWENEDVDVDRVHKRLFISRDPRGFTSPAVPGDKFPYGMVHIIDVSNPSLMVELNAFLVPAGHTTTCVNHCDVIWTAGPYANAQTQPQWHGRPIFGTDVTDPMNPKPCPDAIDTDHNDGRNDYVHDVQVDQRGIAWVSGQGGVRAYFTSGRHRNPLTGNVERATGCKPIPYAGAGSPATATSSRFMHNSWHDWVPGGWNPGPGGVPRNNVLLATEENIVSDCHTSGRFVTYDLRGTYNGEGFNSATAPTARMKVLDTWWPEKEANTPGSTGCDSSHYFTSRGDGLTANAFYTQGVRFLDTSDPTHIRQVGYFVNSDSDTWAAYWHNGYVFVADFQRGVDVLKFSGDPAQSQTVRAPLVSHVTTAEGAKLRFSPDAFGGLCPLIVATAGV